MHGLRTMLERWRTRRDLYAQDGALVSGATIAGQVVSDLEAAFQDPTADDLVTLAEASRLCGYTPDTLRRKIDAGELMDYGQKHRPRVRVSELPRKAGSLLTRPECATFAGSKQGIARAVLHADP
jgi:hypothetical protein